MSTKSMRTIAIVLFLALIVSAGIKANAEIIQEGVMMENISEVSTTHQLVLKDEGEGMYMSDTFASSEAGNMENDGVGLFIFLIPILAILFSAGIIELVHGISRMRRVI